MSSAVHQGSEMGGQRYYVRLAIAVIAVQLVYWLALAPLLDRYSPGIELIRIDRIEVARLDGEPTKASVANARFEEIEGSFTGCCDPAIYAFRHSFVLDRVPDDGLGMVTRINADNAKLFVDGQLVAGEGRLALPKPSVEQLRVMWRIPPGLLEEGENSFTIVGARGSTPYLDFYGTLLGPYGEFRSDAAGRLFLFSDYWWISIAIGSLLALFALVTAFRGQEKAMGAWLAVLLLAWTFNILLSMIPDWPFAAWTRPLPYQVSLMTIALAWANFANEWTRRPSRPVRYLSILGYIAALAVAFFVFYSSPAPDYFDDFSTVTEFASIGLVALAIGRFVTHMALHRDPRIPEAAVFILLMSLLGLEVLGEFVADTPVGYLDTSFPLVILAFAVAFLARNIHLFRSMTEFNRLLSTQLAEREAEIAAGYEERREVERQRALIDERKRIMRDMHDGMGGRLMSLAAQLRGGAGDEAPGRAAIAEELLEALDELRLIVDSLDTAGDDLGIALGAFRARMGPKLAAAGIELDWAVGEDAAQSSLTATSILHIFRILQEACTNTLRHAGADRICVALTKEGDGQCYRMVIADNGQGLSGAAKSEPGHGLRNLERRVANLGGTLAFEDAGPGLRIVVTFPSSRDGGSVAS